MLGKEFPIVVWSIDGKKYFLNLWILKLEVLLEDDRRYKNAGILKKNHLFCIIDKVLTYVHPQLRVTICLDGFRYTIR